jgi:hypothetical protein
MRLIASSVSVDDVDIEERWRHDYLWSRSLTMAGGSSEILSGLVGRQLLGLPRA